MGSQSTDHNSFSHMPLFQCCSGASDLSTASAGMELPGHDSGSDGSIFIYLGMAGTGLTVLSAKNDSDVMFCLQSYQDYESIEHLCINPIHRIGLIHK